MKLPQLALRDLFWLTALAAVCVAWWLDHRTLSIAAAPFLKGMRLLEGSGAGSAMVEDRIGGLRVKIEIEKTPLSEDSWMIMSVPAPDER